MGVEVRPWQLLEVRPTDECGKLEFRNSEEDEMGDEETFGSFVVDKTKDKLSLGQPT